MKTINKNIKINQIHKTRTNNQVLIIMKIKNQRRYRNKAMSFNKVTTKIKGDEKSLNNRKLKTVFK
jgi:diphthamide synthase subunit DPH2